MNDYRKVVRDLLWIMASALLYLVIYVVVFFAMIFFGNRLFSAPRPMVKTKPLPVVSKGDWVLIWSGATYHMVLHENGAYECSDGNCKWVGSWGWDEKTRTFHVHEHLDDSQEWLYWSSSLDEKLSGKGTVAPDRISDAVPREIMVTVSRKADKNAKSK